VGGGGKKDLANSEALASLVVARVSVPSIEILRSGM
jgi:hypothetical protein